MHGIVHLGLLLVLAGAAPAPGPGAAPALPPPRVRAWQTGMLRADRLEHESLAFTLGLGTGLVTRRPAIGAGSALALGVLKELRDRHAGGPFDRGDLLGDTLGAALAAVAVHALD